MKTELTCAVSTTLFATGRQKLGQPQRRNGPVWLSGTVQARRNVSMLTTHADVYLRILIYECMLMSTMVTPDHALVLKMVKIAGVCVLMH